MITKLQESLWRQFGASIDMLINGISSRGKCKKLIECLAHGKNLDSRFAEGGQEGDMYYPILEILLYNMRYTAHHTGQLNLQMRHDLDKYMVWAFRVDELNEQFAGRLNH